MKRKNDAKFDCFMRDEFYVNNDFIFKTVLFSLANYHTKLHSEAQLTGEYIYGIMLSMMVINCVCIVCVKPSTS